MERAERGTCHLAPLPTAHAQRVLAGKFSYLSAPLTRARPAASPLLGPGSAPGMLLTLLKVDQHPNEGVLIFPGRGVCSSREWTLSHSLVSGVGSG